MLCIDFATLTISRSVSNSHIPAVQSSGVAPLSELLGNRLLVLFDGHCALCHASVRWLLRRDRYDRLRFAAAESPTAQAILATSTHEAPNSILVLTPATDGQPCILTRSTAVLACLAALPAPWPQLAVLARLIPLPLRDTAYRLIAHLRYRLARRYASCPLPAPADRHHFL